jgi:hypothetical protein
MRLAATTLVLLSSLVSGQTADTLADRMLARIDHTAWNAPYQASKSTDCQLWTPVQSARYAPEQWTQRCATQTEGLVAESFFYAFEQTPGPILLRVNLRPQTSTPEIAQSLARKLTAKFGAPIHEPQLLALGFFGFGAADHWKSAELHYIVHQAPTGVELIVFEDTLFQEHRKDDLISQADVLFYPENPPSRPFLRQAMGNYYLSLIDAVGKDQTSRAALAEQASRWVLNLLRVAGDSLREERATMLLAANGLVTKLSTLLDDAGAAPIRPKLAAFGVTLGPMTHDGGLAYKQDLLYRVWRDFPDTQAGRLAFVELQQRGWFIAANPGCPTNPDLFHDVIEHGEAFLRQYPASPYKKEVLFTLAVANESWWSIAHASLKDYWVADIPYPRHDSNKQQAEAARARAIAYYEQILQLAPGSPEAASAKRRLPRLKLGLDTGQRRFFCSYC